MLNALSSSYNLFAYLNFNDMFVEVNKIAVLQSLVKSHEATNLIRYFVF